MINFLDSYQEGQQCMTLSLWLIVLYRLLYKK